MLRGLPPVEYAVYAIERKVVHFMMPVIGCTLDWRKESKESVGCWSTDNSQGGGGQARGYSQRANPAATTIIHMERPTFQSHCISMYSS